MQTTRVVLAMKQKPRSPCQPRLLLFICSKRVSTLINEQQFASSWLQSLKKFQKLKTVYRNSLPSSVYRCYLSIVTVDKHPGHQVSAFSKHWSSIPCRTNVRVVVLNLKGTVCRESPTRKHHLLNFVMSLIPVFHHQYSI